MGGSGKLGAPEWSQSRNTIDVSQSTEVRSGVELPRIAPRGSHVPSASSPTLRKGPRQVEPFFLSCRPWTVSSLRAVRGRSAASSKAGAVVQDQEQFLAREWSEVARPRAF